LDGLRDSKGRHQSADWCNQVSGGHLVSPLENPLIDRRIQYGCGYQSSFSNFRNPIITPRPKTGIRFCGFRFFFILAASICVFWTIDLYLWINIGILNGKLLPYRILWSKIPLLKKERFSNDIQKHT